MLRYLYNTQYCVWIVPKYEHVKLNLMRRNLQNSVHIVFLKEKKHN